MKVTIDIPDTAIVLTYQYVFENDKQGHLSILQNVLDSKALEAIWEKNERTRQEEWTCADTTAQTAAQASRVSDASSAEL